MNTRQIAFTLLAATVFYAAALTAGPDHALIPRMQIDPSEAFDALQQGAALLNGDGVKKDEKAAIPWLTKAAKGRLPLAQYLLASCYEEGRGVKKDDAKAAEWYTKSAMQGNAKAGEWVAKHGDAETQRKIGLFYLLGFDVEQDDVKAFKWFSLAANHGGAMDMYCLGMCYDNGRGVVKNEVKAIEWYTKAAKKGSKAAAERLRELGKDAGAK